MEKIQEQEEKIEIFENDIDMYLNLFLEERGIDDMKKESQAVWNGALMYIRRNVFSDSSVLKSTKKLEGYNNNNIYLNNSNCNSYDISIVDKVLDYYIYLCMLNDKEVSINGFSYMTGISQDCIYSWANDKRELSTAGKEIYKKLSTSNEESLEAKLATGNKNPVGVIAILNRRHGWNSPYVSNAPKKTEVLSAAELPNLSEKQTQFIEQTDTNSS